MRRLCIAVSCVVVSGALVSCTRGEIGRDPVEKVDAATLRVHREALENLKTSDVALMDFPDQLALMGKIGITEDRTTVVPARVAGRINAVHFASGEQVAQGQLLATLFSPDFVAAKEEYLQSLRQAKSQENVGADASDFTNLTQMARKKLETMGLSPRDVDALARGPEGADDEDTRPSAKESARGDARAGSRGEGAALAIRAPRSGVIIAKSAVLGNLVNVGDTLFTIGDMSKVWFLGDLYPEDLAKVHKDQEVDVLVPGGKSVLSGKVSFISPLVDPTSRTIKIRALIDNPGGELKADMYVQGNLILNRNRALLVPTDSVVRTPEGDAIFKRVSGRTVEKSVESVDYRRVPVKIGAERQGMTAVLEGLAAGDEVVTDGALLLEGALNTAEQAAK